MEPIYVELMVPSCSIHVLGHLKMKKKEVYREIDLRVYTAYEGVWLIWTY